MKTLIGKDTRVVIQGITGKQGRRVSMEMLDYGTHVVAGVTPGRSGLDVYGVPVYDTVAEAIEKHPEINTSLVSVPREGTKDAALEAITSGKIKLVNILTEGLPRQDSAASSSRPGSTASTSSGHRRSESSTRSTASKSGPSAATIPACSIRAKSPSSRKAAVCASRSQPKSSTGWATA